MSNITDFPRVTQAQLDPAFQYLQHAYSQLEDSTLSWDTVKVRQSQSQQYLSIVRSLPEVTERSDHDDGSLVSTFDEHDQDALPKSANANSHARVQYDIILSPIYRVPVVYFTFKDAALGDKTPLEMLFEHLVPRQYRSEVQATGIIGAISMTDHPITQTPAFFVHPCNTAEALVNAVDRSPELSSIEYLQLWLSIVGTYVGLHVPVALAVNFRKG